MPLPGLSLLRRSSVGADARMLDAGQPQLLMRHIRPTAGGLDTATTPGRHTIRHEDLGSFDAGR
jgi:hypothetical protein